MIKILLAGRDKVSFADLDAGLTKHDVHIAWTASGRNGMSMIAESRIDLVIADEHLADMTGYEFIRKIVVKNPLVNCVAISSLSSKDFHEASEGLGILMQLPKDPGCDCADKLLDKLKRL